MEYIDNTEPMDVDVDNENKKNTTVCANDMRSNYTQSNCSQFTDNLNNDNCMAAPNNIDRYDLCINRLFELIKELIILK